MRATYHDWEPPEDVLTHSGRDIRRNDEFFVEPPEEIGEITSAYTTLTTRKKPMSVGTRIALMAISAVAGTGIGLFIDLAASVRNIFWLIAWPIGLGLLALGICWLATRFHHICTYVGQEGVAKFECSGSRDNITGEMFEFRDATELRTHQVRRYTNGVYQGTDYTYTWTDIGGRKRYTISGTYSSEKGNPKEGDLYHYATAAEMAWSLYLLDDAQRQITTKGEVRFRLDGKNWVAVGEGYLRLKIKGETLDCDTEDIHSVSVQQGVFKVKQVGAKEGWFSSTGVFKFDYDKLANAQLFMFVLDKIAGIRIE